MNNRKIVKRIDGIYFGEGPRWHQNKLWFSDMHGHKVCTLDESDNLEVICEVENQPSGLGWLPNGDLLIVSMLDRKILKLSNSTLSVHADLSEDVKYQCNDMVVSREGIAYVGNFGMSDARDKVKNTHLMIVYPNGTIKKGPNKLAFPNGAVITEDGKQLIVGETLGGRLTSFDIQTDGLLSNRKTWASTSSQIGMGLIKLIRTLGIKISESSSTASNFHIPDGICLDKQNGIWIASPSSSSVLRIEKGGKITDVIKTPKSAYACMLGGEDGKTLFIIVAKSSAPEICIQSPEGEILSVQVDIPKAGMP